MSSTQKITIFRKACYLPKGTTGGMKVGGEGQRLGKASLNLLRFIPRPSEALGVLLLTFVP